MAVENVARDFTTLQSSFPPTLLPPIIPRPFVFLCLLFSLVNFPLHEHPDMFTNPLLIRATGHYFVVLQSISGLFAG